MSRLLWSSWNAAHNEQKSASIGNTTREIRSFDIPYGEAL